LYRFAGHLPFTELISQEFDMSDPFIGEIRMFAGNFAPNGWAFCSGGLLPISENEALFALIGTTYGGDGQTTFGLPDLQGRLPIHAGNGFSMAQRGGAETVTLTTQQIPAHSHTLRGANAAANSSSPGTRAFAQPGKGLYRAGPTGASLAASSVGIAGGGQAHDNMQPYLCVSFIISLFGIFPSQ
jgi:microcystin-dependent protein